MARTATKTTVWNFFVMNSFNKFMTNKALSHRRELALKCCRKAFAHIEGWTVYHIWESSSDTELRFVAEHHRTHIRIELRATCGWGYKKPRIKVFGIGPNWFRKYEICKAVADTLAGNTLSRWRLM